MELETRIGDHVFLVVESARLSGGVLLTLRIGGEGLRESSGRGEGRS